MTYMTESDMDQKPGEDLPPVVTIVLILVGTIGNSLVCLAILLDQRLRNMKNYYLSSLAVTDLLISLLVLPGRMITVRYKFQPSTYPLCFLYLVGDDLITAASAIHICFLCFATYSSLKNPSLWKNPTTREIITRIGLIWLLAFLSIIPYMTLAIISNHSNQPMYCPELLSYFVHFNAIVFIEAMIILVMIIVVFISVIMTTNLLSKLTREQQKARLPHHNEVATTMDENKTDVTSDTKMMFPAKRTYYKSFRITCLVSIAFILSMGPYACTSLFYTFFPTIIIPPILLEIVAYLSYANSVINPFIYLIFDEDFREAFKNIVLFKYKRML